MSAELITLSNHQEPFLPAMTIEEAIGRRQLMVSFVQQVMAAGKDYGIIPGTSENTLLKPGAEKLCTLFGLVPRLEILTLVEDWTGGAHNGEPFFYYLYRCSLYRNGALMAVADGSCNSWEKKYRYRQAQRACPDCGMPAIIRGKEEYGGGYVCFGKRGGCGAKFPIGDARIEEQQVGLVPNPDPADIVNTLQKMAQKRALVAATLIACNASEFFTQDREEFLETEAGQGATQTGEGTERPAETAAGTAEPSRQAHSAAQQQAQAPQEAQAQAGLSLKEVRARFEARQQAFGYTGKAKALAAVLLGREAATGRDYLEALHREDAAWSLAVEALRAQEAEQPAVQTVEPVGEAAPIPP